MLAAETDGLPVVRWNAEEEISGVQIYIKQKSQWQLLDEIDGDENMYKLKRYNAEPLMSKVIFTDGSKSKSIMITQ